MMGNLIQRFISFDKLIGLSIIKVLYFVGAGFILISTVLGMLGSLAAIGSSPLGAIGGFLLTPVFGLIGLLFWRFMCELYILFFKLSEDISAIRAQGTIKETFE